MGIRHRTTPVRALHCNLVERTNRTIKTMIAQFIRCDYRRWDKHMSQLWFAYNVAKYEGTGFTPVNVYLNRRELAEPRVDERGTRPPAKMSGCLWEQLKAAPTRN